MTERQRLRRPEGTPVVVAAACDGACSGNPGPGGWGALLRFSDGSVQEYGGSDPATTNNRMELTAALALLEALRELPRHQDLVIRTDSRYLIDGLQSWLPGWKRRGWRTASGSPVLNRDLWEQLDRSRLSGLELRHVAGHSGDPDNDRCDAIAVAFSRGRIPTLQEAAGAAPPAPPPAPVVAKPTAASRKPAGGQGAAQATTAARAGTASARAQAGAAVTGAPAGGSVEASAGNGQGQDPAPAALQQLLSRLELAERLASGGFSLSLPELARLVEMPLRQLEVRSEAWAWRDWMVRPVGDGRWRLERTARESDQPG